MAAGESSGFIRGRAWDRVREGETAHLTQAALPRAATERARSA
jgi:hypothetical protein